MVFQPVTTILLIFFDHQLHVVFRVFQPPFWSPLLDAIKYISSLPSRTVHIDNLNVGNIDRSSMSIVFPPASFDSKRLSPVHNSMAFNHLKDPLRQKQILLIVVYPGQHRCQLHCAQRYAETVITAPFDSASNTIEDLYSTLDRTGMKPSSMHLLWSGLLFIAMILLARSQS